VPKPLRERLGLKPDTELEAVEQPVTFQFLRMFQSLQMVRRASQAGRTTAVNDKDRWPLGASGYPTARSKLGAHPEDVGESLPIDKEDYVEALNMVGKWRVESRENVAAALHGEMHGGAYLHVQPGRLQKLAPASLQGIVCAP